MKNFRFLDHEASLHWQLIWNMQSCSLRGPSGGGLSARSCQVSKKELHQGQVGGLGAACHAKCGRHSCIRARSEALGRPAGPPSFASGC